MGRVLAIVGPLCSIAGFVLGRFTKRPSTPDPVMERLREHARYMDLAARASRKGHHGEANIHVEAAERMLTPRKDIP